MPQDVERRCGEGLTVTRPPRCRSAASPISHSQGAKVCRRPPSLKQAYEDRLRNWRGKWARRVGSRRSSAGGVGEGGARGLRVAARRRKAVAGVDGGPVALPLGLPCRLVVPGPGLVRRQPRRWRGRWRRRRGRQGGLMRGLGGGLVGVASKPTLTFAVNHANCWYQYLLVRVPSCFGPKQLVRRII